MIDAIFVCYFLSLFLPFHWEVRIKKMCYFVFDVSFKAQIVHVRDAKIKN